MKENCSQCGHSKFHFFHTHTQKKKKKNKQKQNKSKNKKTKKKIWEESTPRGWKYSLTVARRKLLMIKAHLPPNSYVLTNTIKLNQRPRLPRVFLSFYQFFLALKSKKPHHKPLYRKDIIRETQLLISSIHKTRIKIFSINTNQSSFPFFGWSSSHISTF